MAEAELFDFCNLHFIYTRIIFSVFCKYVKVEPCDSLAYLG